MIAVGSVAIALAPVHCCLQMRYYTEMVLMHGLMADMCRSEAELMRQRADACAMRAKNGVAWDDSSEEAETLKCCPYPNDTPRYGSWSEQAAVWERASRKAARAADRHSGMAAYWSWRRPIQPW